MSKGMLNHYTNDNEKNAHRLGKGSKGGDVQGLWVDEVHLDEADQPWIN